MPNVNNTRLTILMFAIALLFASIFSILFVSQTKSNVDFVSAEGVPAYRTGGEINHAHLSNESLIIQGGENLIIKKADNYKFIYKETIKKKTLSLDSGYRLLSYEIKSNDVTYTITFSYEDKYAEVPNGIQKVESTRSGEDLSSYNNYAEDLKLTPEMLDPYYTSRTTTNKIQIIAKSEKIIYRLSEWYASDKTKLTTLDGRVLEDYDVENTTTLPSSDNKKPTSDYGTFKYWVLDSSKTNYTFIEENISNKKYVKVTASKLELYFEADIDGTYKKIGNYYVVNSVRGYGQVPQSTVDDSDKIVRAMWMYDYTVKLNSNGKRSKTDSDLNLTGAFTTNDNKKQQVSNFVINANIAYDFQATTDKNSAFFKYKDRETGLNKYTSKSGYNSTLNGYFVYNYGYEITHWTLGFGNNNLIYDLNNDWSLGSDKNLISTLKPEEGNRVKTDSMCDYLDEYNLTNTPVLSLTMTPSWKEVQIKLFGHDGTDPIPLTNVVKGSDDPIPYNSQYSIANTSKITGKTVAYFVTKENATSSGITDQSRITDQNSESTQGYIIATQNKSENEKLVWNYTSLDAKIGSSGQIYFNGNTYALDVLPVYVDDIYKINLNFLSEDKSNLTNELNKESSLGDYSVAGMKTNSEVDYNVFTYTDDGFEDYTSGLVENYIKNKLKPAVHNYIRGVNNSEVLTVKDYVYNTNDNLKVNYLSYTDSGETTYSFLKQVFDDNFDYEVNKNSPTVTFKSPYIYLVNDHQTGDLPVFDKKSCLLIGWYNTGAESSNKAQYAYTTTRYAVGGENIINLHKTELLGCSNKIKLISESDTSDQDLIKGPITWKLEDCVTYVENLKIHYIQSLTACFYRKTYQFDIETLLDGNLKNCGHILIYASSLKYDADGAANDALILARVEDDKVIYYLLSNNYNKQNFDTDKIENYYNKIQDQNKITSLKLYGDELYIKAFDQSNETVSTGHFDYLIGYKFNTILTKHNDENQAVNNQCVINDLSFNYNTYLSKHKTGFDFADGTTIKVSANYEQLKYNLSFKLRDVNDSTNNQMGSLYGDYNGISFVVSNIKVDDSFTIAYFAQLGYEWSRDNDYAPIVYSLGNKTLKTLDDLIDGDGFKQTIKYEINGEWLRNNYYSIVGEYSVDYGDQNTSFDLGTIFYNTQKIEFDVDLNIYDDEEKLSTYSENSFKISNTYNGVKEALSKYGGTDDTNFYVYKKNAISYAPVSLQYKTAQDLYVNLINQYEFKLTSNENLSYNLTNYLTSIFNGSAGQILKNTDSYRKINLRLNVSPIYEIGLAIKKVENDSNMTQRSVTLTNMAGQQSNSITLSALIIDWENLANELNILTSGNNKYLLGSTKLFTYKFLNNIVTTKFDSNHYSSVQFRLARLENNTIIEESSILTKQELTVTDNEILVVEFVPKAINITEIKYQIDGVDQSNLTGRISDLNHSSVYNNQGTREKTDYYYGGEMFVEFAFQDPIYDAVVKFNDAQYRVENRTGSEFYSSVSKKFIVKHTISLEDLKKGTITITINLISNSSDAISVYYQLVGENSITENVGEMIVNLYNGSTLVGTTETPSSNVEGFSVNEGRTVKVDISGIKKGYSYVGSFIVNGNEISKQPEGNMLTLSSSFTRGNNVFFVRVQKDKVDVSIDLTSSQLSDKTNYNLNSSSQNALQLSDLTIGDVVYLPIKASFKNSKLFALADFESEYVTSYSINGNLISSLQYDNLGSLTDITDVEQITTQFVITEDLLTSKVDGKKFSISIVPTISQRFKLDYSIVDENNYVNLTASFKDSEELYNSGTYVENGTEIILKLSSNIFSKVDVKLNGSIISIIGNEYSQEIMLVGNKTVQVEVSPKQFTFNVKYTLYNTIEQLNDSTPEQLLYNGNSIDTLNLLTYNSSVSASNNAPINGSRIYRIVINGIAYSLNSTELFGIDGISVRNNGSTYVITTILQDNLTIEFQYRDVKIISQS